MVTYTLDLAPLEAGLNLAFRRTVQELERALPAAHSEPIYTWDQQTRRRNGEVAVSPRDVVDLGTLRDSQQPAAYSGPLAARITWDADHAAAVYLGAVFRKRELSLPARNVPLRTLTQLNLPARYARWLGALL